jgi:polyketide synthase PksL
MRRRKAVSTHWYILAYRRNDNALSLCQEALTSFSNSLKLINPNFMLKTIELTEFKEDVLFQELQAISSERIRYDDGKRYVRTWSLVDFPAPMPSTLPLKPGGIYLITGGLGALGQILAEFFAKHYQAKLILTGRSRVDLVSQAKLDRLRTLGSEIIYVEADVSDPDAVSTLITTIKAKWGRLDGIVHTAGMASRTPLMQVNKTEFESGFSAKVYGTYYLDYFTKELDLEFFVTFSSVSAYFGDYGVGSYAYANAFMDSYMTWREQARVQHKRRGLSISLAWPYWEEGGMELSSEELAIYRDYSGLGLLSVEQGIEYFQRAIAHQSSNILIVPGDRIKIEKLLGLMTTPSIVKKKSLPAPMNSDADTFVLHYLKTLLSEATKLPLSRIEVSVDISDYGVDSVMIIAMNQRLATDFPNIRKTLLFEHKTLKSLSHYLQEAYAPRLQEMQGAPLEISSAENMIPRFQSQPSSRAIHSVNTDAIAIIGVSGRYPESEDLEHFWGNLVSGKDCIIEIPAERWDYRPYYQPEKGLAGKICSKWGGFIKAADKFDPFYFTISPREAELMDPQERLMLETGLKVIEDAGYSVEGLHQKSHGSVGVFVGLMWNEYQLLGATKPENGGEMLYGTSNNSSISNRLSYAFDFNGPSVVIDTACSSSLVAIHMACENIRSGACQYAIAGGVNLSLHPSKYVNMSAMGMLSSDGRCCSFGEGGDGYVPGEGVGAVLLKPLNDALRDNDYIYGVIIANAVNHGGKANGFMVPNPLAQSQVIQQALKKFHVDPRSVSYVEAHGTGTPLGDPIEITGLTQAFREFTQDVQFCPIGSVKSNVGHLESAAGIAAVTKVLLQLKNKKYVKSLHSEKLNPHVDFSQTPFYVQQELQDWPKQSFPRRAGISSFGASGSNAHIIIEEAPERFILESQEKFAYLITLSAKCEASLAQKIRDLHHWLQKNPEHATLADISFTLNTGRSHFNYRAAFVVNTLENLSESLSAVNNGHKPANYFEGGLSKASNTDAAIYRKIFAGIMDEFRSEQNPDAKTYQENIETLANFYMKGYSIDWELLHQHESQRRIPLPSYPFLRERYWVTPLPLILNSIEAPKSIKVPLSKSPALHVEPDYYAENWLPYELTLKPGTLVAREHWLLFTNKKSIGAEVASMLSMRKCEVTLVFVGDDYRKLQQHYQINHRSLADMEKVLDDIGRPIHGIIHAWSDNINTINSTEELMEAQELICASSLYLAQILTRRKLEARIYFILNGVHQVTSAPIALAIKSVAQATLLGFGKTLLIEHPELKVRLIDLDPESDITVASDHILQVISSENDESIYAFRKEKCYVPRIEKTHLNHLKHGIEFHSDKSYLITGGLGGLGFAAACWMVKRGARHIILTARSEPSPKVAEKMVGLQQQGAHIRVLRLDIADATFVDAICELRDMPPIVGIIHAAGVQEREPLVKISWEHFSRVLKAKVQGTWNIQQVIARLSLKIDFVVLYSSIAALLGSNRDAPYAAGNAFLDAWAFYQRQQGVPAFCINWGPWGDVGMAAVGLELPGLISVPKGLEILGDVIAQRIPNIAIVSTEYLKFMFQFMPKPLFTWLPKLNLEDSKDRNENHAAQQWNLSLIQERIKSTLYKILPIDPSIVITDKSDFFDLGMESIRALEFGRQLQKEFTLKLSDAIIFDCPNMGELSAHLSQNLLTSNIQNVSHISVSNEESVRLFCFPYAAGTRKVFAGWADILPKEIEVYPVDYTKSVSRNFPYDLKTVREIAEELAEILPWDKPSFFFGSCLGSLVSWELAQVLQAQNRPLPQHLFVAACAAPNLYPIAMRDTTDLIDNYRQENNLPRFGREILVDEWFPLVQRELKEIGPAPFLKSLEAVGFRDLSMLMNDRTLFDVFYPRAVVDMSLALSFRSSDPEMLRPLPCPITAFDGQLDPLIRREFMRSWQLYTKGEFQLLKLQGDHYFIHDLKLEILKQIKAVFDNRIKHKNRPLGLPLS